MSWSDTPNSRAREGNHSQSIDSPLVRRVAENVRRAVSVIARLQSVAGGADAIERELGPSLHALHDFHAYLLGASRPEPGFTAFDVELADRLDGPVVPVATGRGRGGA